MVQVYFGDGKGKTTAAVGQALRALGAGWRVVVVQFLKDGTSSELGLLRAAPGCLAVLHDGPSAKFTFAMDEGERAASRALHDANLSRALELVRSPCAPSAAAAGSMLVLDEALDALRAGLLDEGLLEEAVAWGSGKGAASPGSAGDVAPAPTEGGAAPASAEPPVRELVVTGHDLPESVRTVADYLTEMRCERHPYRRGVVARRGIEY